MFVLGFRNWWSVLALLTPFLQSLDKSNTTQSRSQQSTICVIWMTCIIDLLVRAFCSPWCRYEAWLDLIDGSSMKMNLKSWIQTIVLQFMCVTATACQWCQIELICKLLMYAFARLCCAFICHSTFALSGGVENSVDTSWSFQVREWFPVLFAYLHATLMLNFTCHVNVAHSMAHFLSFTEMRMLLFFWGNAFYLVRSLPPSWWM